MISKVISIILVAALLHSSLAAQNALQPQGQSAASMQQVVRKAQENDKAVKITLFKKVDQQRKLAGKVSEISDAGFTLINQKTGMAVKLDYDNVQQVKEKGMSTGWKIALVAVAGLVIVVVIATRPWRSE